MILKALTLENFKGIREPVRIELSPISLLFGSNNGGTGTRRRYPVLNGST